MTRYFFFFSLAFHSWKKSIAKHNIKHLIWMKKFCLRDLSHEQWRTDDKSNEISCVRRRMWEYVSKREKELVKHVWQRLVLRNDIWSFYRWHTKEIWNSRFTPIRSTYSGFERQKQAQTDAFLIYSETINLISLQYWWPNKRTNLIWNVRTFFWRFGFSLLISRFHFVSTILPFEYEKRK